jgi:hypothetical protein
MVTVTVMLTVRTSASVFSLMKMNLQHKEQERTLSPRPAIACPAKIVEH